MQVCFFKMVSMCHKVVPVLDTVIAMREFKMQVQLLLPT
jgi:hypothetical protein